MQIYFRLLWSGNRFIDFAVFLIFFVDVNYQENENFEKIQNVKIRLSLKTNDISLTITSNLLYFNFINSR